MRVSAFEVASRYVYPSIRRRLVEIMRSEKGLKQLQIAELLHISQSAVSRYLRMNRGSIIDVSKFDDIDSEVRELAERIIKEKLSEYEIHKELMRITLDFLKKGYGCSFHARIDPEIDPNSCRICMEIF
ncbi:transcriptional regulator [Pyrococcus abyssi]|nr:transcriptional regulator [Pyrococcus abyssi]